MFAWLLYAALLLQAVAAVNVTVDLGYARYRGKDIGNGVLRWAGMRYARSVSRVDGLRFTAPQEPIEERNKVTLDASKFGPLCIGSQSDLQAEFGSKWSEDCLFVNVFAPASATNTSKLPVYVFIQGGGFNMNGNANYDGRDLIDAAHGDMVVVNFNYRVGPYGFLASREIEANKTLSLNNGLKDQRMLLKWVQKYIHEFGGNAEHVTVGGASAGGGSVVLQLTAFGGRNDNLFHAAAAESAAFPPLRNVTQSQWQYDALLKASGCADLTCLSSLDAVTFQKAVRSSIKSPFPGGKNAPIYFWNPTLDYDFIQDYTYKELKHDRYVKVPTIFGDATNDGINFTPNTISNYDLARQFILDQFPSANWPRLRAAWKSNINALADPRWRNLASDVYGHIRYTCPNLNMSASYAENNTHPTFQYRWNVGTASHVGELPSIWGNGTTASSVFMQAYWASFIRSFDPNTYTAEFLLPKGKLDNPVWTTFGNQSGEMGNRLRFGDENSVVMEQVSETEWERCRVVSEMGLHLEQPVSGALRVAPLTSSWYLTVGVVLFAVAQGLWP